MTLGFAAATVVAVNAQDVATQDETVEDTQQEVVQEPTVDGEMGEDEGVMSITEAELPEEVTKSLQDSDFSQATIEEVYVLEGVAVDKLMQNDAEQFYIGEQNPDKIYQLRVTGEEEQSLLYFNEQGDLMGSKSM